MPRHVVRLILLLVTFGILALAGIKFLTVDSFYQYGHYRGKSVAELASEIPNYKGTEFCRSCHAQRVTEWSDGAHNRADAGKVVRCEVCHGAAGDRKAHGARGVTAAVAAGAEHPKNLKLAIPADTRQLCTLCHEKTAGRPAEQPQIVVADHAGSQQCGVCHNPHSPKIALAAPTAAKGDGAKGKTKAAACAGCHEGAAGAAALGPSLAGQNAGYFIAAFKAYGTGERDHPMMSGAGRGLSEDDVADLAAYYGGLACTSALAAAKANSAAAQKCVACHGTDGATANGAWPNLVGFSRQHLAEALQAYRSGARKNPLMASLARDLSDAEVDAASAYYAAATCK